MMKPEKIYRLYLDVCCLNRPLDDATQDRVRLEAEAVLLIYHRCRRGEYCLVSSNAIEREISRTPDLQKAEQLMLSLNIAEDRIGMNSTIRLRSQELFALGFKTFDAIHLASAEQANVDVFLTTDDRLRKRAVTVADKLRVQVENPITWLMSISQTEERDRNDESC